MANAPSHSSRSNALRRIARTAFACAVIAASLLTFPSHIPWIIAGWLLVHSWLTWRGQSDWIPLALCAAIVLVKRVAWPPGLLCLAGVMLVAGLLDAGASRWNRKADPSRHRLVGLLCLWLAWLAMAFDWHADAHASRKFPRLPDRPVICLGDSLTSGVPPDGGYPQLLMQRLEIPVLDYGQPGISTAEGLKLLPKIIAARPQAVVIELGGHDFLKGIDRATTKRNLETIITAVRNVGAEPILMEIPRGFIVDPFAGLERELAREHDLELISDGCIRKLMLFSPHAPPGIWIGGPYLSDDGLHPNALGNRELAEAVEAALNRLFLD